MALAMSHGRRLVFKDAAQDLRGMQSRCCSGFECCPGLESSMCHLMYECCRMQDASLGMASHHMSESVLGRCECEADLSRLPNVHLGVALLAGGRLCMALD